MLQVFFNHSGYFITGETFEASQKVSPRLDTQGKPLFDPLQHLYAVLARALQDLRGTTCEDIMVYNDTRLIEEVNGVINPLFPAMTNHVRRVLVPSVKGCVLFRKKPDAFIRTKVEGGQHEMVDVISERTREKQARRRIRSQIKTQEKDRKSKVLLFKQAWLDNGSSTQSCCGENGSCDCEARNCVHSGKNE
jgi:hypothetical protein